MNDLMSDGRPGVAAFAARNPIFALRSKYPTSRMPQASAYFSRGQLLGRALLQNSSERRAFGLLRGVFARLLPSCGGMGCRCGEARFHLPLVRRKYHADGHRNQHGRGALTPLPVVVCWGVYIVLDRRILA